MKIIYTSNKDEIFVDDEDFDSLSKFVWYISKCRDKKYAIKNLWKQKPSKMYMHRLIMGVHGSKSNLLVDHINGNGLDNRKNNLRLVTNSINTANRPLQSNNTSGFKCVYKVKNKWVVVIKHKGKNINFGTFDSLESAALVSQAEYIKFFPPPSKG